MFKLVFLFETAVAIFLFSIVLSQLVIPAWRGTPLFPFFRKEKQLAAELADARQDKVEAELKAEIKKVKKSV